MLPDQYPCPVLGVADCPGLPLLPDCPDSTDTDHQTEAGRHNVDGAQDALGEDVESDDDTDPLPHVEQGVLDWVEDGEDEGEADDVVDGVAEGGDEQVLAVIVDVVRSPE